MDVTTPRSKQQVLQSFEKHFPQGKVTCIELEQVMLELDRDFDSTSIGILFSAADPKRTGSIQFSFFVSWLFGEEQLLAGEEEQLVAGLEVTEEAAVAERKAVLEAPQKSEVSTTLKSSMQAIQQVAPAIDRASTQLPEQPASPATARAITAAPAIMRQTSTAGTRAIELRAMSLERLAGFYTRHHVWIDAEQREPHVGRMISKTMEDVVLHLIRPATWSANCSFAELGPPANVEYYVSHWWGEEFTGFTQALHCFGKRMAKPNPTFWIDSFAQNHHSLDDARDSDAFTAALQAPSCQGAVLVLGAKTTPPSRLWCLFEVLACAAPDLSVDLVTRNGCFGSREGTESQTEAVNDEMAALRQQMLNAAAQEALASIDVEKTAILQKISDASRQLQVAV